MSVTTLVVVKSLQPHKTVQCQNLANANAIDPVTTLLFQSLTHPAE